MHNQTFPMSSAAASLKVSPMEKKQRTNQQHEQLSRSLPLDNVFVDHGYASPTHQQNNSTKTVYFGEQIQTIMRTFEKLESMHAKSSISGDGNESSSPNNNNKEMNLEIWKQKIHFRLKVLDDQMNEMDGSINNNSRSDATLTDTKLSSPTRDATKLSHNGGEEANGVIFHPTTREIRELIENVNRRYTKLGQKYLTTVSDEL